MFYADYTCSDCSVFRVARGSWLKRSTQMELEFSWFLRRKTLGAQVNLLTYVCSVQGYWTHDPAQRWEAARQSVAHTTRASRASPYCEFFYTVKASLTASTQKTPDIELLKYSPITTRFNNSFPCWRFSYSARASIWEAKKVLGTGGRTWYLLNWASPSITHAWLLFGVGSRVNWVSIWKTTPLPWVLTCFAGLAFCGCSGDLNESTSVFCVLSGELQNRK